MLSCICWEEHSVFWVFSDSCNCSQGFQKPPHLWELSEMWMESTLYSLHIGAVADDHKLSDTHCLTTVWGGSGHGPHFAGIQAWARLRSFLEALGVCGGSCFFVFSSF